VTRKGKKGREDRGEEGMGKKYGRKEGNRQQYEIKKRKKKEVRD
jgi:hypothetical protein